jgi:hypothetical protein
MRLRRRAVQLDRHLLAPANTCDDTINGGASTQYIGTIYTQGANWTINGGDRSPLAGQVICYTASVSGAGAVGIDFNPTTHPPRRRPD